MTLCDCDECTAAARTEECGARDFAVLANEEADGGSHLHRRSSHKNPERHMSHGDDGNGSFLKVAANVDRHWEWSCFNDRSQGRPERSSTVTEGWDELLYLRSLGLRSTPTS